MGFHHLSVPNNQVVLEEIARRILNAGSAEYEELVQNAYSPVSGYCGMPSGSHARRIARSVKGERLLQWVADDMKVGEGEEPKEGISLCMMANREEYFHGTLADILHYYENYVDEIVLQDNSAQHNLWQTAAQIKGLRYVPYRWNHDFGSARNNNLRHARYSYVIILDTDEVILPDGWWIIREEIKRSNLPMRFERPDYYRSDRWRSSLGISWSRGYPISFVSDLFVGQVFENPLFWSRTKSKAVIHHLFYDVMDGSFNDAKQEYYNTIRNTADLRIVDDKWKVFCDCPVRVESVFNGADVCF